MLGCWCGVSRRRVARGGRRIWALRVVIDPVESEQRRSRRWRQDLSLNRVAPLDRSRSVRRK